MLKQNFLSSIFLFSLLLGLNAWAGMQQHTVPLPDDNPAHQVAAPGHKSQEAPATALQHDAESGAAAPSDSGSWKQTAKVSGVRVDFRGVASLKDVVIKHGPLPVSLNEITSNEMVEGQQAVFQFRITDATGEPMTGLRMAAWLDQAQGDKLADNKSCHDKIQSFLQMQMSARPEVDLNTYYLLALTKEPSIMIIDPRVGFGSSKLYAVIDLAAPGADWVQARNGDRIFVSMPSVNQVAAIDSLTFRMISNIKAGGKPSRIVLQPDGKYLWVANDEADGPAESGVTVIDTTTFLVVAHIPTGKGHHEIAVDENQNVYVSNQQDGTVSVINGEKLAKVKDIPVGKTPVAMAYSARSKSVYAASRDDGKITVISAEDQAVSGTLAEKPGLTALAITPDGRWGFVANGTEDRVSLFDVSSGKFTQQYKVGRSPDQLAFTVSYVYVQSRESETISLIPLSEVGSTSHTAEFPAGQNPPGELETMLASPITSSLEGDAAFVTNPADRRIYYYTEGMAAPMFSIEGYGKTPTALMLLDRSIHETAPGIYSVGFRLPAPGLYDVPIFVDSPAVSHCFEFTVKTNPLLKKHSDLAVDLHPVKNFLQTKAGETVQAQFKLVDPDTGKPRDGLKDVRVTVLRAEGLRQTHLDAEPKGDGVYQFSFTPPANGVYYATVQIPSLKIRANQLPYIMIRAAETPASEALLPEQNKNDQPKKQ